LTERPQHRSARLLFLSSFFLSGAAALIYQLVWSKQLQYIFGSTSEALGMILAIFMAGIGFGAHLFGRRIDRSECPLALYAKLELAVGAYGMFSIYLLRMATQLFTLIGPQSPVLAALIKILLTTIVLAPPALLMGATYPALLRGVSQTMDGARRDVGLFYAINLLGALGGALLTGLLLLPQLGLTRSVQLAGLTNLLIGLVTLWVARSAGSIPRHEVDPQRDDTTVTPPIGSGYISVGLFFSGATIMALEIVVTRVLTMIFGVSAQAFSIVLALFLLGLGIGALLYRSLLAHRVRLIQFAWIQAAVALLTLLTVALLPTMPRAVFYLRQIPGLSFNELLAGKALIASTLILPLAIAAGLGLPVLIGSWIHHIGSIGRNIGRAYLVNTVGTIFGSLCVGFWLIDHVGTRGTLITVAATSAALAVAGAISQADGKARFTLLSAGALLLLAIPFAPSWPVAIFINSDTDGSHTIATTPIDVEDQLRATPNRILFFDEGRNATIAVTETPSARSLLVNAHPDGSDTDADMATQVMLGAIPLTLHPQPEEVLVIGFGTGVSAYAAAQLESVQRIDAIEIEPGVLAASPWFHHVNGAVEEDPRVQIHLTDARGFVATTEHRYDVVISEPSNPWRIGVANLYTEEFFSSVDARLKDGGVLAQWMHLYSIRESEFKMVLATMSLVFDELQVWWLDAGNVVILGSGQPIRWSAERAAQTLDGTFRGARIRYAGAATVEEFYGRLLLDTAAIQKFIGSDSATHSDDLPRLEYLAPRGLIEADGLNATRLVAAKLQHRVALNSPSDWLAVASMFEALELPTEQRQATQRALELGSPLAAIRAAQLALADGSGQGLQQAQSLLQSVVQSGQRSDEWVTDWAYAQAELAIRLGQDADALAALQVSGEWEHAAAIRWLEYLIQRERFADGFDLVETLLQGASLEGPIGNPEVEQIFARAFSLVQDAGSARRLAQIAGSYPTDERLSPLIALKVQAIFYDQLQEWPRAVEACDAVSALGVLDLELLQIEWNARHQLGQTAKAEALQKQLFRLNPSSRTNPPNIPDMTNRQ
jgi:spermidine synthase